MLKLSSEIRIGKWAFSGVHDVRIRKSLLNYVQTATIVVPSVAYVRAKDKNGGVRRVKSADEFNVGDKVTIALGYNGEVTEEFSGFVKTRTLGMPLSIECEGYVRQLRLNNAISGYYKTTSVKELLLLATKGTDITVEVPEDMPITGGRLIKASGVDICEFIKSATDGVFKMYFKEPKVLWAGLIYTSYAAGQDPLNVGLTKYRLGWNCKKDNGLVRKEASEPVEYLFNNQLSTGQKIFTDEQFKYVQRKVKRMLVHIPKKEALQKLAGERTQEVNYVGYSGKIEGFLIPKTQPGYKVEVRDTEYPELNGNYLCEGVEITYGINGAWRTVEIGHKLN